MEKKRSSKVIIVIECKNLQSNPQALAFCIFAKSDVIAMQRKKIISSIASALHSVVPSAKVILYGSQARGDARKDSDIDLLILTKDDVVSGSVEDTIYTPLYDIELQSGISIHPFIIPQMQWQSMTTPFSENVKKEGIVL